MKTKSNVLDQHSTVMILFLLLQADMGGDGNDGFGDSTCRCDCHQEQTDDRLFTARRRHCANCGTKVRLFPMINVVIIVKLGEKSGLDRDSNHPP